MHQKLVLSFAERITAQKGLAKYRLLAGLFILRVKLPFIILWISSMYICIGGDLDGEVVNNREGTYFEASEIDPSKQSTYNRQSYKVGENTYRFWLCAEMPYMKATKIVSRHLAEKYKYLA